MSKRTIIIVIAVIILIVLALLLFWPRAKPVPTGAAPRPSPAAPAAATKSGETYPPSYPPATVPAAPVAAPAPVAVTATNPAPAAAAPAKPKSIPPTSTMGIDLTADQSKQLAPILKKQDDQIAKIAHDQKLSDEQRSAEVEKLFEANREAEEKILKPDQYRILVLREHEHAGEVMANR